MSTFFAEFPVKQEKSCLELLELCARWIEGMPRRKSSSRKLSVCAPNSESKDASDREIVEQIYIHRYDEEYCGVRYEGIDDNNVTWNTEVVGSKNSNDFWISVKVYRQAVAFAESLPNPKKPYILKLLVDGGWGGSDGPIEISNKANYIAESQVDVASKIINGDYNLWLPVVYFSKNKEYFFDSYINKMARKISGVAHIFVEPSVYFSRRLSMEVGRRNVYGGVVGVYWPEGAGVKKYFLDDYDDEESLFNSIYYDVSLAVSNRIGRRNCTWNYLSEINSRRKIEEMKHSGSDNLDEYIKAFDKELEAKESTIKDLQSENSKLRNQIKANFSTETSGIYINHSPEGNFYPGEILSLVVDSIQNYIKNLGSNGRRSHVARAILENNPFPQDGHLIEEEIKSIFNQYDRMNRVVEKRLMDLGFSISDEGKHYKIIFMNDPRYTFAVAKTPSDHRAGKNTASDICRSLFK